MWNLHTKYLNEYFKNLEINGNLLNIFQLSTKISPYLFDFRAKLINYNTNHTISMLRIFKKILGLGEGSTPMSDDIFLGVIATIYTNDTDIKKIYLKLAQFPFHKITTSTSSKLIKNFLHCHFPIEIHEYLRLLKIPLKIDSNKILFINEINKIKSIGASSGECFLLGSLWEMKYRQSHPK